MSGGARAVFRRWSAGKRVAFVSGLALLLCAAALAAYDRASHLRAQHIHGGLARGDAAAVLAWLGGTAQDPGKAASIVKLIQRFDTPGDPRIVRFAPEAGFALKWPPRLTPVGDDLLAFTAQGREGIGFVRSLPAGRLLIGRRLPAEEQGQRTIAAFWLGALGLLLAGPILAKQFGWIGYARRGRREEEPIMYERHRRSRRGADRPETVEKPARRRRRGRRR